MRIHRAYRVTEKYRQWRQQHRQRRRDNARRRTRLAQVQWAGWDV